MVPKVWATGDYPQGFRAGAVGGGGLTLVLVFVSTDEAALGLTLTRPLRLAVGCLGLVLWCAGFGMARRLWRPGTVAGAKPIAAADGGGA